MNELKVYSITTKTLDDLKIGLINIASHDEDINGNNGEEYIWERAKEDGYSCSLAWLEYELWEHCGNKLETIERFVDYMSDYGGYTIDWDYDYNENQEITSVAIAMSIY